ncbi:16212_t:CDS:2, partial [Cetraspora pellucida]
MADSIHHKFDEYYQNINDTIKIATILDPRVKCSIYAIGDETNNAICLLRSKMAHYSTTATLISPNLTELSPEISSLNQSNARSYLRNLANQFRPTVIVQSDVSDELERYLAIPIDENCDPLKWWKVHNRLDPETARAILCLKSWITEKIGEKINNVDIEDIDIDDEMDYEW